MNWPAAVCGTHIIDYSVLKARVEILERADATMEMFAGLTGLSAFRVFITAHMDRHAGLEISHSHSDPKEPL